MLKISEIFLVCFFPSRILELETNIGVPLSKKTKTTTFINDFFFLNTTLFSKSVHKIESQISNHSLIYKRPFKIKSAFYYSIKGPRFIKFCKTFKKTKTKNDSNA